MKPGEKVEPATPMTEIVTQLAANDAGPSEPASSSSAAASSSNAEAAGAPHLPPPSEETPKYLSKNAKSMADEVASLREAVHKKRSTEQ